MASWHQHLGLLALRYCRQNFVWHSGPYSHYSPFAVAELFVMWMCIFVGCDRC